MESFDDEVAAAWEAVRKKNLQKAVEKELKKEKPEKKGKKEEKTEKKEEKGETLEESVQETPSVRSIIPEAENFFSNKPEEIQNVPRQTVKTEGPKQIQSQKDLYSRKPDAAEEKNYAPMVSASSEQGFKLAAKPFQIANPLESSFNIRPVQRLMDESQMPEKRSSEMQNLDMHYESPEEKLRGSEKKYKLFK